jgi:hypothetical protein
MEGFWSKFKKTFGTQSQRKPGYTAAGLMGSSASRKQQTARQMESLRPVTVATPRKSQPKTAASFAKGTPGTKKVDGAAPAPKMGMTPPAKTASPTSRPAGRKTSSSPAPDAAFSARKALGGAGGLSEENAVMKRLKQRAMERAVSKQRSGRK